MFLCSNCKAIIELPRCSECGNEYELKKGVWQLSDMPDMVVDGEDDKYIGYEHIGENYSGNRKYVIEDKDFAVAKEIAHLTGDGIFLDLACGDGCFTVPVASLGTKVIAGDISNTMLKVLKQKAEENKVSLQNVTLCRMNALEIPLADESVDTVVANSVLHLISNPEKVIGEICRVLKKGGCFICIDDAPGKNMESGYDVTFKGNEEDIMLTVYRFWRCCMRCSFINEIGNRKEKMMFCSYKHHTSVYNG